MTEADSKNYWISPTALKITLNALSDADYMQASAASGAMIMCYMKGIDGLEYDHGHNYKRWPLKIAPTYFTSVSRKYVYVRIPRPTADPAETESDVAQVVFPSERIDLYGMTEEGEMVGEDKYYYIYTQGIISASEPTDEGLRRHWEQDMVTGTLASDEATEGGGTGEWWMYDPITDMVTFTKTIASAIFEYLEAAQAVIHNLNVTGVFDAIKGYIDDLRSHNYQSGLLDGAGFRLTSDNGEGASELEVDMLKVRKKATFMELEIREETFVGGNQHYSPAGSTIYRVDYLDENDQVLGYTVMKVPFLLKRFAFLGKMFNYAARKRIRRSMSDDEWKQCHHFRCYLLADDGTTATRNWWQVGDQPRCQTFNKAISAQNKRDNGYNWKRDHFNDDPSTPMPKYTTIEGPVETSYYWRLVTNVGSEKLEDNHAYDFIDMPYEGWDIVKDGVRYHYTDDEKRSFRDGGSGIPVAGDTIVCMGNRTKQDRMNMISLYTSGSENNPPAIKGYRGIHTFKINQENRVFELSPEEVLIRSKAFRLLDDSGYEFPVPLERGEWQQGVRYHWYDRASWKGSIWLCQVLDDYQWVDIAGNSYEAWRVEDIDYGEGDYEYAAGMTDHYYRTGRVNGIQVYYIKYYTTSEPDRNNDLWLREVSKGTEITSSEIHYAASLNGLNHPADDAADWKTTIAATGISMGKYLWTRTTIHYDDPNNPDREPTREYSVARWGIDGDGIAEIDSYYLATSNAALVVNKQTDTYPKPGDAGWAQAGTQAKWYATFGEAAAANGGVGAMQGWNVWEKTIIKYDAYNDDGTQKTVPDLVNYRCSRIGQDGQIGEEEYYMLAESDDFATVFGSATPDYAHIGIRWYNQSNPAAERWRLSATTPNINTQMWSAVRPTYNKDVHGKKVYLWNFEQRVDGTGTEYATRPVCIGNHARGIKGVIELYALSASQTPVSADRPIPADINAKNQWGVIPTSGFEDPQVWGDEKYDRAPTEALPYQWNWTRTLYSSKDADGKDYEDHYHVSAVRGTRGEDGAGIEFIYCRPQSHNADGTPIAVTVPDPNVKKDAGGTARTAEYIKTHDDFVPYQWTDNPVGIDFLHQIEYRSERKSSAVAGTGGFTGGHEWGLFSAAAVHSKWGKNGQDGDGVEYVYIRTATNVAPTITNSSDTYGGKTYLDDDYLPLSSAGRCTDDPVGTSHSLPYEWVVKRTKGTPDAETGVRQWEKYSGTMALWANFSESITKKSESYRYATNNTGTRPAASSSDWKTTKPALQQGYWLYTETTITWSDNSTTVLYTDERNPNDGVAGQDIIVDGSTEMKYYVGDSNTSHPAESSSDWKDLSQVTQTQGKWLWSKATTYYRKASSAAGSKDAGHSVNYNVSYISKDGAAGRAVTGITEYYKATSSDAEMPVPTSDSGWSTNPNVSNWGATDKYLWNYEKVTYSSGTTVERTKPQIVAIWTKDGANGRGIDSITNYYKITSSATPPSKPSTDGGDGWDDDPTAPGAGEYLWNYEKVTYTDGTVSRSEVQLIGHVGTNGANGRDGSDGAEGKGIKLTLNRDGLYTDANWDTWGTIGRSEAWSYRSGDPTFTSCRVGDIFVVAGASSDSGRRHVAQYKCTAVNSSSITGTCISHIADGKSIQGAAGHVGRWYYYADEWNANTEYKFEATRAPYVKRGNNFYMLDCAAWPDTQQSSSTYISKGQDPTSTYGSGNPWSPMTAVFKYMITEAIFANNASLGSFVINGDWMITKHGLIFDSSGGVHLIDDTHSYSGYSTSNAYTLFDPNYPNASRSGVMNFCPAWAVDGLVGRQYHNGVYDTNKAGSVSIDSAGFAVKWGGEGFRVGTAGLQRYDNVRDAWLPMYNKRNIMVDKYKRYGRYTLPTDVDFFLNTYVEDNYDKQVQLPASSSLPDGAIITVRGWSEPCYTDVYAAPGDALSMGNTSIGYVEVENADRVDFVLCKQLSPATWLVNYYDVDY